MVLASIYVSPYRPTVMKTSCCLEQIRCLLMARSAYSKREKSSRLFVSVVNFMVIQIEIEILFWGLLIIDY